MALLLAGIMLLGTASGCSGPAPEAVPSESGQSASPSAAGEASSLPATGSPQEEEAESMETVGAQPVTDAAFHRGTITSIDVVGGMQTFTLTGAAGSGYGVLTVAFDQYTAMDFDPGELEKGDQVEVYFSGLSCALDEKLAYVVALSAAKLPPEEATHYNGVVVEVLPGDEPGEGTLVMRPLGSQAEADPGEEARQEFVFHYGPQTVWRAGLIPEETAPGDELHIYHRGVATMSIPPQGSALEIGLLTPETYKAVF